MNKVSSAFVKGTSRASWLFGAASAIVGFAIVAVVMYGVIMRYVLRSPTAFSLEAPEVLFIAIIALCLAYTQARGRHVRVEIITSRLHGKTKDALEVFVSITTLIYYAIVVWALWERFTLYLSQGRGTIEVHIPLAPFSLIIVAGMGVLALQVIAGTMGFLTKRGDNSRKE